MALNSGLLIWGVYMVLIVHRILELKWTQILSFDRREGYQSNAERTNRVFVSDSCFLCTNQKPLTRKNNTVSSFNQSLFEFPLKIPVAISQLQHVE